MRLVWSRKTFSENSLSSISTISNTTGTRSLPESVRTWSMLTEGPFEKDRIDMFDPILGWFKDGLLTILMDS